MGKRDRKRVRERKKKHGGGSNGSHRVRGSERGSERAVVLTTPEHRTLFLGEVTAPPCPPPRQQVFPSAVAAARCAQGRPVCAGAAQADFSLVAASMALHAPGGRPPHMGSWCAELALPPF